MTILYINCCPIKRTLILWSAAVYYNYFTDCPMVLPFSSILDIMLPLNGRKREFMYKLTNKQVEIEGTTYTVYGISYDDEFYVEDISPDRTKVEGLVADCNKYSLDPVHLYDIIEDFIS